MLDLLGGLDEAPATTAIETQPAAAATAPGAVKPKRGRGRPPGSKNATGANRPLYFDIETIPDESRLELFGLEPVPVAPPATPYEDCPKPREILDEKTGKTVAEIAGIIKTVNPEPLWLDSVETIEKESAKPRKGLLDLIDTARGRVNFYTDAAAERSKLLSTCPEFCRIVSIAFARGEDEPEWLVDGLATRGQQAETEKSLLEAFWFAVRTHGTIIGFHVLGFDLPAIFIRSALLGVEPTKKFDLAPWKTDVIDLSQARFPKGAAGGEEKTGRPGKLKTLARVYGIEIPAGDDDGSKVAELYKTDPARVGRYNASDVVITREVHRMYQGFFCV